MTKEQAITRIKHSSMYIDDKETADYIIKALEQPTSDDCVSRKAMLDAITEIDGNINMDIYTNEVREIVKALSPVTPTQRWISVSERLPEDRDWYLGIFKEHDTGWINPVPFICDYVGRETKATTKEFWILRGLTDIDNPYDYYKNLECVAWQPLPQPYE